MEAASAIKCNVEKFVDLPGDVDFFSCTSRCAGNEENQINRQ
jgi:hypothetical protein